MRIVTLLLLSLPLYAQAHCDNPDYCHWKKFPVGTSITHQTVTSTETGPVEVLTRTCLKSVAGDHLVLATRTSMVLMGEKEDLPEEDIRVPARIPQPEPVRDQEQSEDVKSESGQETVNVLGRGVACAWFRTEMTIGGERHVSKVWTSEEIPGRIAKMESSGAGNVVQSIQELMVPKSGDQGGGKVPGAGDGKS